MNPYHHTVGELLDFIESIATHTPNASECDCHMCSVHNSICGLSNLMVERGSAA